jgi:molybdopterin molybdotransferase
MISVTEAKQIISTTIRRGAVVSKPLIDAVGAVLAEDVFSTADVPYFDQSAMDGYAIHFRERKNTLVVRDEAAAGETQRKKLQPGEAIRIFTGAPVPDGADAVVMQEKVSREGEALTIHDDQLEKGKNIRPTGSEIKKGELAMESGSLLTAGAIGFLAGAGINNVKIYAQPSVAIIVTGNELVPPGQTLSYGKVFESNSFALTAALKRLGAGQTHVAHVTDDPRALSAQLHKDLQAFDMVLLTGGISVGKYDFVLDAVTEAGVQQHFHKVKQKPGKPLYYGTWNNKPVFGLPGNPSSVLTCFFEYVVPAIELMTARKGLMQVTHAPLSKSYSKAAGLTHFLKARFNNGTAETLHAQESYRMSSFAQANCLICVPEETTDIQEGELVEIHLLPV